MAGTTAAARRLVRQWRHAHQLLEELAAAEALLDDIHVLGIADYLDQVDDVPAAACKSEQALSEVRLL